MTLFEMFQIKVTAGLASNDTIGFTVKKTWNLPVSFNATTVSYDHINFIILNMVIS